MSRRRYSKPTPTVSVHVSEEFYHFIERYSSSRVGEPKYRTLDRLMYNHINNNGEGSKEIEELREIVQLTKVENRGLKEVIVDARRKIREYEYRLGIISKEEVQLQEKNELMLKNYN